MKLHKVYEPAEYERDIYSLWEKSGAFAPTGKGEPFSTIMPPPNANANLHIGHALNYSVLDIITRYQRLNGRATLFLPGADHAGFETQVVYEKHLAKEGKSRFDFSREELYKQIMEFVQANKHKFENQLRMLGASCDWSRFMFTLDDPVVTTAYGTFKKMWDDKLIYRGERLVNYCTFHRTSFADIEVLYEERKSPLYYLKYGPFTLATTRPETKFGDTAVAVNPDDKRYKQYVGKLIKAEGINGPFKIRVIADEYVDPDFGTGVVKITPAHDFNDWDVAQRHKLPAVKVINLDGTLNEKAGKFAGMPVEQARTAVTEALKKKGLLEKVDENYQNRVGVCYKCGTVIEPMLMDQWFINMAELAKPAIKSLKADKIKFYPAAKRDQVVHYLENVRDWNISRQIAWGIPIPAFQNTEDKSDWIFDERVGQETIEVDGKTYRRDPDVFDTWFSSGQWPFTTLGYPDGKDYKHFYPNTLMECGIDILYQWVARMVCLGLYVTGKVPFETVYLHGMVRSQDGRKMSKSLGNVIDPQETIETYGSDALRMGIIAGRSPGFSSAYAPSKVEAARNFTNKIWNIARYIEGKLSDQPAVKVGEPNPETIADHWMLDKLHGAAGHIGKMLDAYRLSEAYDALYHLVWDDVADWYIEASKDNVNLSMLAYVLDTVLKLAHPFAPFMTETVWQTLKWEGDSLLINAAWPSVPKADPARAAQFNELAGVVNEVRHIMSILQVHDTTLYFTDAPLLAENAKLITRLAGLKEVRQVSDGRGLHLTHTAYNAWLDVDHENIMHYQSKLAAQHATQLDAIGRLEARLANGAYVKNAPKEKVAETEAQLAEAKTLLENIAREMSEYTTTHGVH